jgi:glycosyltransferase involved in cell wall biosynthesis
MQNGYSQVIFLFPRNISFPPRRGDSQRVFFIAEATLNCGLGVSVFYFDAGKPFTYKKVKFYPLPGSVTADPSKAKKFSIVGSLKDLVYFSISAMMVKRKIPKRSILYAHTPIGGLVGLIIKIFTRSPLIYDPHDWFYEDWVFYHRNLSNLKKISTSILFKLLNILLVKFPDYIVCVSPEMFGVIKTRRLKILIPNFAEKDEDSDRSQETIIKDDTKKLILFAGHIALYQGIINLLKAFKIINEKDPNAELLVIGDGEDFELAKGLVKKLNLNKVIFTGKLSHENVYHYIKRASLCVAPFLSLSFVKTSCPIKLLEYAAFDKKIVTTDIPAFRRILVDNNKAYFSEATAEDLSKNILLALNKKVFDLSNDKNKNNDIYTKNNLKKKLCALYERINLTIFEHSNDDAEC